MYRFFFFCPATIVIQPEGANNDCTTINMIFIYNRGISELFIQRQEQCTSTMCETLLVFQTSLAQRLVRRYCDRHLTRMTTFMSATRLYIIKKIFQHNLIHIVFIVLTLSIVIFVVYFMTEQIKYRTVFIAVLCLPYIPFLISSLSVFQLRFLQIHRVIESFDRPFPQ